MRRPDRTLATADHNVPTDGSKVAAQIRDQLSRVQVETLESNCAEFGVPVYSIGSSRQGIVHVIGPELGVTQPGMTIVCGDSHTSTHGAFGALAFGIGTSEVEHVLATQTLQQRKPKAMRISYEGELGYGVSAKDLILGTIGKIGVEGGVGYVIEYAGPPIEALSMEGRMTVCNMTIEGGGRAGMIAPDDTTFEWVEGREAAPADFAAAVEGWRELHTEDGASFDTEHVDRRLRALATGHLGDEPRDGDPGDRCRARAGERGRRAGARVHGARGGHPDPGDRARPGIHRILHEHRIGDLREAAEVVKGRKVAASVSAMVVPGSQQVAATGRVRGPRRGVQGGRLRLALGGLLDVPGHEPGHPGAGRALRLDLEPELRGPPGPRRAHPPREPEDGGRGRDRGPFRRHP